MRALGISSRGLPLKCKFDDMRQKIYHEICAIMNVWNIASSIDLRGYFFPRRWKTRRLTRYFVPKLIRLRSQEKSRVISDSALSWFSTYIHVVCERFKRLVTSEAWQWLDLVYLNKFNYGFFADKIFHW